MKKKVLGVIAVVAVAAIAGYNVYTSQNDVKLSDLVLSNVEALANVKEGGNECIGCVYTRLQICRTLGDWGACLGEESGNLVELFKILRRPELLAVCFVIHPAVDGAFKQVLAVVQQLYAGGGGQGIYPAPHYGILVDGPVQEGVQTAGDAGVNLVQGLQNLVREPGQPCHVQAQHIKDRIMMHMVEGLIYFLVGIDGDVHRDTGFFRVDAGQVAHGVGAGAVQGQHI